MRATDAIAAQTLTYSLQRLPRRRRAAHAHYAMTHVPRLRFIARRRLVQRRRAQVGSSNKRGGWAGIPPPSCLHRVCHLPSAMACFPPPRVAPQSPKAKAAWLRRRPAAAQQPQQKSCNPNRLQFFTSHPSSHPPIHLADTRQCPVLRVIFSLHGPWKFGHSGPVSGCCSVRPLLAAVSWTRGGKGATKLPPSTPL